MLMMDRECVECHSSPLGMTVHACPSCGEPVHGRCLGQHTCEYQRRQLEGQVLTSLWFPQLLLWGLLGKLVGFVTRLLGRNLQQTLDEAAGVPQGYRVGICASCFGNTYIPINDEMRARSSCYKCRAPFSEDNDSSSSNSTSTAT